MTVLKCSKNILAHMNGYVLFCLLICLRKLMNFDACQLNRNKILLLLLLLIFTHYILGLLTKHLLD